MEQKEGSTPKSKHLDNKEGSVVGEGNESAELAGGYGSSTGVEGASRDADNVGGKGNGLLLVKEGEELLRRRESTSRLELGESVILPPWNSSHGGEVKEKLSRKRSGESRTPCRETT